MKVHTKISNHEINVGFLNTLPKKCLNFNQGLRNYNHVRDLDISTLYEVYNYEENLIAKIILVETRNPWPSPISIAFLSNSVLQEVHDDPTNEEDVRNSNEYMNDLNKELYSFVSNLLFTIDFLVFLVQL